MSSIPDVLWQSGFNGALVVVLLVFGRGALRAMERSLDRNTRAITLFVLAVPSLPKPFADTAHGIMTEIRDAARERKDTQSHETPDR